MSSKNSSSKVVTTNSKPKPPKKYVISDLQRNILLFLYSRFTGGALSIDLVNACFSKPIKDWREQQARVSSLSRACTRLEKRGLLRRQWAGLYQLTDAGREIAEKYAEEEKLKMGDVLFGRKTSRAASDALIQRIVDDALYDDELAKEARVGALAKARLASVAEAVKQRDEELDARYEEKEARGEDCAA